MEKIVITNPDQIDENMENFLKGEAKGVIRLAVPVVNISEWYGDRISPLSLLTGLTREELDKIIYYKGYALFDKKTGTYRIVGERERLEASEDEEAVQGAPALMRILELLTREALSEKLGEARKTERECMQKLEKIREEAERNALEIDVEAGPDSVTEGYSPDEEDKPTEADLVRAELRKARMLLNAIWHFQAYGTSRLFVSELNLFPLQLRSILENYSQVEPYAVYHDISGAYCRIVSRNERLKTLISINAPEIIIRNESRILQEYVDELIANGKRTCNTHDRGDAYMTVSLADAIMQNIVVA